ncbi:MAG: hypothetical protein JXB36_12460, partial [Gammaproteobacteria bacterium]|nr:hypothetical protein [Gammaproteobacteria bacterium]
RAFLRITSDGIEANIPRAIAIDVPGQTSGEWRLRWEDVRRVRLISGAPAGSFRGTAGGHALQRLRNGRLVIQTVDGEFRLGPFLWIDPAAEDHRLGLGETLSFRGVDPIRRMLGAPLVRAFTDRGFEVDVGEAVLDAGPVGYDLMRHKGMVVQIGVIFGAGLYALADTFFVDVQKPLGPLPLAPFVLFGVVAGIAVSKLGRGAPNAERIGVGLLAVGASVAAAYPATLRFNAATADPAVAVYISAGGGRFVAPDGRLPPIDLSGEGVPEYFDEYPPGTEHEFAVLRGAAGFYQLEMAPFHARTRRFYDGESLVRPDPTPP